MKYQRIDSYNLSLYERRVTKSVQNIFSDEPWYQGRKCEICGSHWGTGHVNLFNCCDCDTKPYWPDIVISRMLNEICDEPKYSFWVAEKNGNVSGFTWGFCEKIDRTMERLDLSGDLLPDFLRNQDVVYQAAIAVSANNRGLGLAGALFELRENDLSQYGSNLRIVRTAFSSNMYYWLLRKGFVPFYFYKREQHYQRVVLYKVI